MLPIGTRKDEIRGESGLQRYPSFVPIPRKNRFRKSILKRPDGALCLWIQMDHRVFDVVPRQASPKVLQRYRSRVLNSVEIPRSFVLFSFLLFRLCQGGIAQVLDPLPRAVLNWLPIHEGPVRFPM